MGSKASSRMLAVLAALAIVAGTSARGTAIQSEVAPLPMFDGTWYEVATYGSWWQRRCMRDTTFHLTARSDLEAVLRSRCRTATGVEVRAGRLRASAGNGHWRTHFAPAIFGWLPAVWSDFWVLGHDRALTWFVAGERGHERLSVFSRTVTIDEAAMAHAMALARQAGFDVERLVRVTHDLDGWRGAR